MTTLQRVRRGLHIRLNWPILRAGVPEDFTNAESLTLHISRVNNIVKTFIPDTHISISGNVVSFIVTSDLLKSLTSGEYKATIAYRKVSATSPTLWEPYIKDEPCFALVDSSTEVGGSTTGMEVVTIKLDGEIGIPKEGQPGASAYRIALAHGFEGDEAEWLLSLKQPAIDAAGLAIQAAGAADAAAGKANTATSELDAIKQFLSQAESGRNTAEENRETKEGQRQQTEQARLTSEQNRKTAEENRETKEGQRQETEQARITSEQNRKTAEENRETKEGQRQEVEQQRAQAEITRGTTFDQKIQAATDATTAANASAGAQNTYNVTVAVPLATGVYYTKTTARAAVPVISRKLGLVLTYATADKIWYTEKYIGTTVAGWATEENWEYVPTAANMATKTDKTELEQLRSDIAYMYPSVPTSKRVLADAGTIKSRSTLNDLTNKFLDLLTSTKLLFCPHFAVKLRESGIYKYVTKLYDVGPWMLDSTQTTALSQPYLSGNISPNEKYSIKSPNGGNAYMTHSPISFLATDKWSISTIINSNGSNTFQFYCGGENFALYKGRIGLNQNPFSLRFDNDYGDVCSYVKNNYRLLGKQILITFIATGNGELKVYVNGKFYESKTINTQFRIAGFIKGHSPDAYPFCGKISYHCIRDIELTSTQVLDEYTYLRSIFPEIENVQTGTQYWATSNCEMTCTPQGNVIQETQSATTDLNPNLSTNPNFDIGISGYSPTSVNVELGYNSTDKCLKLISLLGVGFAYFSEGSKGYPVLRRIRLKVRSINMSTVPTIYIDGLGSYIVKNVYPVVTPEWQSYEYITYSINVFLPGVSIVGQQIEFDDVSVQEVGWSDSTNIYNSIYAATTGTTEQKEYAAVKAAAMWCHYNNDPALGAIYGKLYNWYAVKLLQMDIDYYNTANPTSQWGWRVPTKEHFDNLIAFLGGNSVAGGKMKKEGLNYWDSPNTMADNSSGYSAIGSGYRDQSGGFGVNRRYSSLLSIDGWVNTVTHLNSESSYTALGFIASRGYSLRLIKA